MPSTGAENLPTAWTAWRRLPVISENTCNWRNRLITKCMHWQTIIWDIPLSIRKIMHRHATGSSNTYNWKRVKTERALADAYNRIGDCFLNERNFDEAKHYYAQAESMNASSGDYSFYQLAPGIRTAKRLFRQNHSAEPSGRQIPHITLRYKCPLWKRTFVCINE